MDIRNRTLGFIKKQRSRYLVTCSSVTSLATTHLAMVSFFSFLSTFYIKILKCGYKLIYYSAIFSHLDLLDKSRHLPLILALVHLALRLLPPQHRDVLCQLVDHMHLSKNTNIGNFSLSNLMGSTMEQECKSNLTNCGTDLPLPGWPVGFGRLTTTSFSSPHYRLIIDFLILYRLILSTFLFSGYLALI